MEPYLARISVGSRSADIFPRVARQVGGGASKPTKQTLIEEIAAWKHNRNANYTKANWQFTTQSARVKLNYLYPSI